MRRPRGERGQLVEGLALFGVGLAAILAIAGLGYAFDQAHESARLRREQARAELEARKASVKTPHIDGPAIPNHSAGRECFERVAATNGLQIDGGVWRSASKHPEPVRTGDVTQDTAEFARWEYALEETIKKVAFQFDPCYREQSGGPGRRPQESTTTSTSRAPNNWSGSYAVTPHSKSTECLGYHPAALSVSHGAPNVTITFAYANGSMVLTGPLSSDASFGLYTTETFGTGSLAETYDVRLRGRFDRFSNSRVIRSGVLEVTSDGQTCTIGFEATA